MGRAEDKRLQAIRDTAKEITRDNGLVNNKATIKTLHDLCAEWLAENGG